MFNVGDKVRFMRREVPGFTGDYMGLCTVGKVYTVTGHRDGTYIKFINDLGRPSAAHPSRFDLANPDEERFLRHIRREMYLENRRIRRALNVP